LGINEAPVVILVCVDRRIDPLHAIEAGATATQNITLAAHSLGLGAGWIGVWGTKAETTIRKILKLPETTRAVSLVPIGIQMNLQRGSETSFRIYSVSIKIAYIGYCI